MPTPGNDTPGVVDAHGNVRLYRDDSVTTIVFSRPQAHNALTETMYAEFDAALQEAETDSGLKALVLRGAGARAFTSGTDARYIAGDAERTVGASLRGGHHPARNTASAAPRPCRGCDHRTLLRCRAASRRGK